MAGQLSAHGGAPGPRGRARATRRPRPPVRGARRGALQVWRRLDPRPRRRTRGRRRRAREPPCQPGTRSVLVAHAYVSGATTSESERPLSLGGAGDVPASVFAGFDYAALGHLHRPQRAGDERVRYAGSLLKYSFSEHDQRKSVTVVDIGAPGRGRARCARRREGRVCGAARRAPHRGHARRARRARTHRSRARRLRPRPAHRSRGAPRPALAPARGLPVDDEGRAARGRARGRRTRHAARSPAHQRGRALRRLLPPRHRRRSQRGRARRLRRGRRQAAPCRPEPAA